MDGARERVYKPTHRRHRRQSSRPHTHGDGPGSDVCNPHIVDHTDDTTRMRTFPLVLTLLCSLGRGTRAGQYGLPTQSHSSDEEDAGRLPHRQPLLPSESFEDVDAPWRDSEPGTPELFTPPGEPLTPEREAPPQAGQAMDTDEPPNANHDQPPSPAGSSTSTSTTDELNAALDLPEGSAERAATFERLALQLGVRQMAQTAGARGPAPARQPQATVARGGGPADAATQTFVALPPQLDRDTDAAMVAALHERHVAGPEGPRDYEGDGTYVDHNPLLHIRDYETHTDPVIGPRRSTPWPSFMARANAEAQTPRAWTSRVPPIRQGYLSPARIRGTLHTASQRIWLAVPTTDPRVPLPGVLDDDDMDEIRAEEQGRASGIWISIPPIPPQHYETSTNHRRHQRSARIFHPSRRSHSTLEDPPLPSRPGSHRRMEAPPRDRLSSRLRATPNGRGDLDPS